MHKHPHIPSVFLLAVVAASVAAGSQMTAQQPGPRLAALNHRVVVQDSGVYSDAQAEEGTAVYKKTCAECHELEEFTNGDFKGKWGERPLFDLFEQIRTTMPDGDPGTLQREEYGAVLSYILKLNGLPSGPARLSTDSAALAAITLKLPAAAP